MLRKLALSFLITILPIQSWAVVSMSLQKEVLQFGSTSISSQDSHHPCHQEVALNSDDQSTESNQTSCYACSLCMAFGATLITNPILRFESPTQSLFTDLPGFSSEDLVLGNKPPIL
jgi:hypothetical protein